MNIILRTAPKHPFTDLEKREAVAFAMSEAISCRRQGHFDRANHWEHIAHATAHDQFCWWSMAGGALYHAKGAA